MSHPLQSNNQPSSSPSKSSLRRTSGPGGTTKTTSRNNPSPGPTTHFASEATQHHFLPHSPPNQNLEYEEDDDALTYENEDSYQTAIQPNVSIQPFFTLIEDTRTNEHFHPTVHYIFADDEPDIITEAACRSLEQAERSSSNESQSINQDTQQSQDPSENRLPPARPGVKEHYIILDVQPTPAVIPSTPVQQFSDRLPSPSPSSVETAQALLNPSKTYPFTVTSAQSLSADWQVFRTSITDAPTMNAEHQADEQHLMLRIEGRRNSPDRLGMPTTTKKDGGETTEEMIDRFQSRLAEIRHLMLDLDIDLSGQQAQEQDGREHGGDRSTDVTGDDLFTDDAGGGGLGVMRYHHRPSGFGNAVLDEQD